MDAEDKMKKSVSNMREQLSTLRVGRASPSLLDRVIVDYYDTPTPLNQLASVSAPTPSQLVVDVYDKSSIGTVEKALLLSDLGMNPSNDGKVIRLNVPQLTSERRKVSSHISTCHLLASTVALAEPTEPRLEGATPFVVVLASLWLDRAYRRSQRPRGPWARTAKSPSATCERLPLIRSRSWSR